MEGEERDAKAKVLEEEPKGRKIDLDDLGGDGRDAGEQGSKGAKEMKEKKIGMDVGPREALQILRQIRKCTMRTPEKC